MKQAKCICPPSSGCVRRKRHGSTYACHHRGGSCSPAPECFTLISISRYHADVRRALLRESTQRSEDRSYHNWRKYFIAEIVLDWLNGVTTRKLPTENGLMSSSRLRPPCAADFSLFMRSANRYDLQNGRIQLASINAEPLFLGHWFSSICIWTGHNQYDCIVWEHAT